MGDEGRWRRSGVVKAVTLVSAYADRHLNQFTII